MQRPSRGRQGIQVRAAPGKRGLSLGESELALSANVDDRFFGNLIVSLTPDNTLSV